MAFAGLAAAVLALAEYLHLKSVGGSSWLLAAGAGLVIVVLSPVGDEPASRARAGLHAIGGLLFYVSIGRAMFLAGPAGFEGLWLRRGIAVLLPPFILGAISVPGVRAIVGLLQRLVFALVLAWAIGAVGL